MKVRAVALLVAVSVVGTVVACSSHNPNQPSVTFVAPLAQQPVTGTSFKFKEQPITLTITNAARTGSATVTYTVEVASDTGFANKVFSQSGIAEGSSGTTTLQITSLAGGTTYFWRSKATVDGVTGQPSTTQTFVVRPQIILSAPPIVGPASGSLVGQTRPTFTITDAKSIGPVGTIFYEFQVSSTANFATLLASGTVQEQPSVTSWTPSVDLPVTTLFWRARTTDPSNTEVSDFSGGTSFVIQPFNMHQANIYDNPPDLPSWAETATITFADTSGDAVVVEFDKRTSPDKWPESGFGTGGIQYTLGMCLNINGQWDCSAAIQFWDGRELTAGGRPWEIGQNWFYDRRWGPMSGYQPAPGELVGIFVAQGNLRGTGNTSVKERSKVVLMPFGSTFGG